MAEKYGWIKLYRQTLDNPIVMKDSDHLAVWIYLILNATHDEYPALFKGEKITLKPGQLITGRKAISNVLGISESKIFRIINCFKSEHQIEQQTSNKNSLISIVNWDLYQSTEQQIESKMNSNRTASEQQVNTNKNVKNVKNVKKVKECKKIIYSDSPELNEAILSFMEHRKSIKKPMSDRSVSLLIGKLNKMSNSITEQIEILNQSILNGWQGIFPLKKESEYRREEHVPSYIKKNSFNSFKQNEYDFSDLEKRFIANENDSDEGMDDP